MISCASTAFELGGGEHVEDRGRRADRRGLLRAAHRERVGHPEPVHHTHARLGQVGLHAQPLDGRVQLGGTVGGDLVSAPRVARAILSELVQLDDGAETTAITMTSTPLTPTASQDPDQEHVHEMSEQEHRGQTFPRPTPRSASSTAIP